jgi:hypothetical protein
MFSKFFAKGIGYRPDMNEEKFRNPSLFWLSAQPIIERWLFYFYFLISKHGYFSFFFFNPNPFYLEHNNYVCRNLAINRQEKNDCYWLCGESMN